MKTKMLKSGLIVSALILTFIFSSYIGANKSEQEEKEGYVMVRVSEIIARNPASEITTVYEDGTVETMPLNVYGSKTLNPNLVIIQAELSKLKAKGYTLISSTGGPFGSGILTTYVFEKK